MKTNSDDKIIPENEPYALRYSDYYEYNGQSYIYRLQLENFNDNQKWPLENCINCNANLKDFPAKPTSLSLGKDSLSTSYGYIFAFFSFCGIVTGFILSSSALIWFFAAALFGSVIFFILLNNTNTKPVKLYHCSKCNVLLHNETPAIIQIDDAPKIVFPKLEQLPGFKLK